MGAIWSNPFTSTTAAATAVVTVLHTLGVNIPGLDTTTAIGILATLIGVFAKDWNVTGGTKQQ
jgi:hypothetical protein